MQTITLDQRITCIDEDWFFTRSDHEEAKEVLFDHSGWRQLNLPHDWSIEGGYDKHAPTGRMGGFVETGIGWYRKIIYITEAMLEQKLTLIFDGVYMKSDVYLNGHHLGHRPYGYISFEYALDEWLQPGVNIIAVRIDCLDQPSSRWYNGCGIYRHVWLRTTEQLHLIDSETVIRTPVAEVDLGRVIVSGTIAYPGEGISDVMVLVQMVDAIGNEVASGTEQVRLVNLEQSFEVSFDVLNPDRWSPDTPSLYVCKLSIQNEEGTVDWQSLNFGIRKTAFIPQKGFYLNDQPYKFKGVCLHHSAGVFGAAVPETIQKKRLEMLKTMGCNAVRTAHNPFSPEFYDMCDSLGIMVMDEAFDGWEKTKATFDYGLYFDEWHKRDVIDFIKRDRNHPSIMIWSIGNEVHQMDPVINKELTGLIREYDNSRPITCGVQGTGQVSEANRSTMDIAGYNDGGGACFVYDRDHEARPDQLMIATEAPHTSQTRGFYRTQTWWRDKNQPRIEIDNLCDEELFFDGDLSYRSSYDNSGVRTCIRDSWSIADERPFLMGEFRWSGIDYYGESFGWPARNSCSGVIGTDYIQKDAYYLYQSMWSDKPMVHMLPHWTHPHLDAGTLIPIWVYTNCDSAEIYLNGQSQGIKVRGNAKHLQWDVPYELGTIEVVAYKDEVIAARDSFTTAGEQKCLRLEVDAFTKGCDTVQVNAYICDGDGVMVPSGDATVYFSVSESLNIVGTENGDSIDTTPVSSHKRNAFNGICIGMVQSKGAEVANGDVWAAAILGEKVFKEMTNVSIDCQQLSLSEASDVSALKKQIKINDGPWCDYIESIQIDVTTQVQAKVYVDDVMFFEMTTLFVKGEKEKVIDLAHGNKVLNLDVPVGPFADRMVGVWADGNFSYRFSEDGKFNRIINDNQEQSIGHWWYDFPVDAFEAQEYAGQGEVWFNSGERNSMAMVTQEAKELRVENDNGAIGSAYGHANEIILVKVMED